MMTAAIQNEARPAGPGAEGPWPMKPRFSAVVAHVLAASGLVAAVGAAVTWPLAGRGGLACQAAAWPAVVLPFLTSGIVVCSAARRDIRAAAVALLLARLARVSVCLMLAGVAWAVWDLSADVLMIWVGVWYLACLGAEGLALARVAGSLRRRAAYGLKGRCE